MPSVLFVCTANRFRSPLAAAVFRKLLQTREKENLWRVESAGTWTRAGLPATPEALQEAAVLGLDLSGHESHPIDGELLARSDLVLVMEANQLEAIRIEFHSSMGTTHLLSEVAVGSAFDIPDPYRMSNMDNAHAIAREICQLIEKGFDEICRMAGLLKQNKVA